MRLPTNFDPIVVGDIDNFGFDFTADIGSATALSTQWVCMLAPYQVASDPTPQSRILATSLQTMIEIRSPLDGTVQTKNGCYSIALVGGMPASAVGATYILEATVMLSDGRVLSLSSTVLCAAP